MVKKIITRVVVDIASGRVLEKKSFEYRGKIAECKGGQQTSTSTTELPAWLQPYAQQFIDQYKTQAFDENGNVINQPADLNQQLAGLNSIQDAALQNMVGQSGDLQRYSSIGLNQSANTLGGAYLNPDTNPYLGATYDRAARKLTDAYSTATAPSIMASAQQSGNFGGSAMDQAMAMSQYGLGENLADLGTSIYGGNYANERSNQLNTLAQMPSTLNAAYTPQQALYGAGAQYQQQQQGQYDTDYSNALNRTQFPFEVLSGFGGALGQAGMGAGTSSVKASGGGGGGMMGSVFCSWIFSHGLMPQERYEADARFGLSLPKETLHGYHVWAVPTVRLMQNSRTLARVFAPVVNFFAKEIALRADGKTGSFVSRKLLDGALAVCGWLGRRREAWATQT